MQSLLVALVLGIGSSNDTLCPPPSPAVAAGYYSIDSLLSEVRRESFPELGGETITLNQLRSASDYFISGTELRTLLNGRRSRDYLVYVNPRLYLDPPPRAAIRAVLAHELVHVADYSQRSTLGLARFTVRYLTSDDAEYERSTDVEALRRGYGCGLMAYREWLYQHVSPSVAQAKRRSYLTPEEIRARLISEGLPRRPAGGAADRE